MTDDRHAQELLAQDITMQNMAERHAQELTAYEITVANLRAERDAAMKDAERYRWLREHGDEGCTQKDGYGGQELRRGERLDAAIDAAIARADRDGFRKCEFCGCNTNAKMRACCDAGRNKDKEGAAAAKADGEKS